VLVDDLVEKEPGKLLVGVGVFVFFAGPALRELALPERLVGPEDRLLPFFGTLRGVNVMWRI
jgi:hypothetical protein